MLVSKGRRCSFMMEDGKKIAAPRGAAMLHDPEGATWGRCSVLLCSFTRGKPDDSLSRAARSYFGAGYQGAKGSVSTPSRSLDGWQPLGPAAHVYYVRNGNIYGGVLFHHKFRKSLFGGKLPLLYRKDRFMRLELGPGCTLNARGFVSP